MPAFPYLGPWVNPLLDCLEHDGTLAPLLRCPPSKRVCKRLTPNNTSASCRPTDGWDRRQRGHG
eukprot:2405466-Rhodomonas_salina.1